MISPEEAVRLATGHLRRFTSYEDFPTSFHGERLSHMDKEHGDVIDFQALRPGPQVYFPATPYEPVADTLPELVREAYGPHYVIPFYNPMGIQVLVASVPAEDFGYWIGDPGRVRPAGGTGAIRITRFVVSAGAEYPVPLTPECAVRLVGQATGRKIARAPEAVYPGMPWAPPLMYWKLTLDAPVPVRARTRGDTAATEVLYVGLEPGPRHEPGRFEPVLFKAAPDQPAADTAVVPIPGRRKPPPVKRDRRTIEVPIRPGAIIRFDKVELLSGSIAAPVRHFPCRASADV